MALIHGSWLIHSPRFIPDPQRSEWRDEAPPVNPSGCLFLWGEIWRSTSATPGNVHPFAMTHEELGECLRSHHAARHLTLPTSILAELLTTLPAAKKSAAKSSTKSSNQPSKTAVQSVESSTVVESRETSSSPWHSLVMALPSHSIHPDAPMVPFHSAAIPPEGAYLEPWTVEGLCLMPDEAIALLQSLPLAAVPTEDAFLASDLQFWTHMVRWSLDLMARSKFLPTLERAIGGRPHARWRPLLDSGVDQARLQRFSQTMPGACRLYAQPPAPHPLGHISKEAGPAIPCPIDPVDLLQGFLRDTIDTQVRAIAGNSTLPRLTDPALSAWLQHLEQVSPAVAVEPGVAAIEAALEQWTAPLQHQTSDRGLFRTALKLHPPSPQPKSKSKSSSQPSEWRLEYGLQALDDEAFWLDAPTIWQHPVEQLMHEGRAVARPQETFLMGLGLASRIYPVLEASLQEAHPQWCPLTSMQAYEFIKSTAWRLQDSGIGVVLPIGLKSDGGWANRLGLRIQAQTGKLKKGDRVGLQSLLNFQWELTIGGQTLSKAQFDRLVAQQTPLVEINGEWVELRPADIKSAQNFFATRNDQTTLSLEDALRISTGDTQMIEKLPVVSFEASGSLHELINTLSGKRTIEEIETPKGFKGELRPYQSRGVGWLSFLEEWGLGACLADDMGLGKTPQLIAFLLNQLEQKQLNQPTLIVCPTSVLGNWEREVKKFAPKLKVIMHHGDKRSQGEAFAKSTQKQHVVITSYALLYRDLATLQSVAWRGIVLDEAQNIKNPEAKQSQAVRQLEAEFRIALTGTPVENRLTELWSILEFLNPGYLGPRNFFQRRFATPIERYGDTASLQTLRSLVQPFILRRLKTDKDIIQDLPEKQEMTVFCGLTAEQAGIYQRLVEKSLADIEAAEGIQRKGIILALLTKLKQICNHPALFLKESDADTLEIDPSLIDSQTIAAAFQARSGKLQRLEEMLEEVVAEGDRALIFTQFAEWGKLLKAHLEARLGQETLFLYGSTSKPQREAMIDRFQNDPQGPKVFILSLKAGGVGLNLTRANHVFHFDRWWNPAVENQATDRVFRIGQTRNVQVHKFVCNGTLEEKIHDLIDSKKALAEQVVSAGENWLTDLDSHQLRDLLLLDRTAIIGD